MRIRVVLKLVILLAAVSACQPGMAQPEFTTSFESNVSAIPSPSTAPRVVDSLSGRIRSFAVSPDLNTIALATSKGIVLYDLHAYKSLRTLNESENGFSVAWSSDGNMLAVGSSISGRAHVTVYDTTTWNALFEPEIDYSSFPTNFPNFGALAWSHDGDLLAASHHAQGLAIFDIKTGEIVAQQKDFLTFPYHIAWSPDDSRIVATGDLGFGFRRWRLDNGKSVRLYDKRLPAFAIQLAWSHDGERIASIHADGAVCFWTSATNQCNGFIKAHHNGGFSLAWSSDGNQLATGGGVIRLWDTHTGKLVAFYGLNATSVYSQLQWLANGVLVSLETGYADKAPTIVRFWDVERGAVLAEFHGANSTVGE